MKRLFFILLMLAAFVRAGAEDAAIDPAARERLKILSAAVRGYIVLHDGKAPEKLSVLFYEGLVRNLSEFLRPGSPTTLTAGTDIDTKSDYTLEPIGGLKDIIVREKSAEAGKDKLLAAFADGSIKLVPAPGGSTTATTPATSSPTPATKASSPPSIQPSPTADSGLVVVPNLALFGSVSKMKAELERVGLVGNFSAKGKPPTKALEFKFASQLPLADTKVKPGTKVEVFIYQKFEEATTVVTPSTSASATPAPGQGEDVLVPNLAQYDTVSAMNLALKGVGLVGSFNAKSKPPTKALEFKFASQLPAANTKAKRGSTVVVSIYQKFEESSGPPTTYSTPGSTAPPSQSTPPPASSAGWVRRDSGDPTSNLEGAKWIGTWRGKVIRTAEPIAGGGGPNEEEYTLIRRRDGSEVWIRGSAPLFWYEVGNGKIRFKTKDTTPPQYTELEQRGDHWAGRWVAGDKVLATFDLAPMPKPNWLSHM